MCQCQSVDVALPHNLHNQSLEVFVRIPLCFILPPCNSLDTEPQAAATIAAVAAGPPSTNMHNLTQH